MMTERPADHDVERVGDDLEREADRMERHSAEVGEHIDEARDEWDRRRSDDGVPGAQPRPDDEAESEDAEDAS